MTEHQIVNMVNEITADIIKAAHKKLMSELFLACQPNRGDVFSFMDDHPEILGAAIGEALPSLQEIAEKEARIERLEAALTAAAEQLHKVHADAFRQAGGYALLVADGKDFSCFELNRCEEEARKARAVLRDTETSNG